MSHYAEYIKERLGDGIIETPEGFATYRIMEDGKTVYIVDIYVVPEARQTKRATALADDIADMARKAGCTSMIGSVMPSAKGSTESLKVLLGYGMRLESADKNFIVFRKDL